MALYAIRVPSGDHEHVVIGWSSVTIRTGSVVCARSNAQISGRPPRFEMNAIRSPSGDQVGSVLPERSFVKRAGLPPVDGTV